MEELEFSKNVLSPRDIAEVLGVNTKTVNRWGRTGKLPCFRTPGGHLRFNSKDVKDAIMKSQGEDHK